MKTLTHFILLLLLSIGFQLHAQSKSIKITTKGKGNPVLFLPGFASDASVWQASVSKFSATHKCHVVDYAGFGKVAPIEFPWLETIQADLKNYVASINNKELIVIGHSMGGTLAAWLAAQPDLKIKEIIIVDGLPCTGALMMPNFAPENMVYGSPYNKQILEMDAAAFEQMAAGMSQGMAASSEDQKVIKENILRSDRKTYVLGFTDYLKLDVRPLLDTITVPVTILGAGQPYGKEMATQTYTTQYSNLVKYNLYINEYSKHFIMMDAPEWMEQRLEQILGQ